jgi:tetratricopeptide (TPR) repeat protein
MGQRSFKVASGVKVNVNKRSVGLTVGGKRARYTVNSKGRSTATVRVPGASLRHTSGSGAANRARTTRASAPAARPAVANEPRPGLFASRSERAYYRGVKELAAGRAAVAMEQFRESTRRAGSARAGAARPVAPFLMGGFTAARLGEIEEAIGLLEQAITQTTPIPDRWMQRYGGHIALTIEIGPSAKAQLPLDGSAPGIFLAQCHSQRGDIGKALEAVRPIEGEPVGPAALGAICKIHEAAEDWDGVIRLTAGIVNDDDITLSLWLMQAGAMEHKGLDEAAIEVYKDTLRSTKRNGDLLTIARYQRAKTYLRLGNRRQALRDLNRLYADHPDYEDVAALLEGLTRSGGQSSRPTS